MRYVRIEFAGFPTAPNEELNSLTMAAVGAHTVIEYIQVIQGLDDSYEWFGGAVNGRYLISYESGDDHFDASEGYIGRNQFHDRLPVDPAGRARRAFRRRRLRPAGDRERRLLGGELQRRQQQSQRVAAVHRPGLRQLHAHRRAGRRVGDHRRQLRDDAPPR
jgi:hypothetical protein